MRQKKEENKAEEQSQNESQSVNDNQDQVPEDASQENQDQQNEPQKQEIERQTSQSRQKASGTISPLSPDQQKEETEDQKLETQVEFETFGRKQEDDQELKSQENDEENKTQEFANNAEQHFENQSQNKDNLENNDIQELDQQQEETQIVDEKYGDYKIDLTELQNKNATDEGEAYIEQDPSRPQNVEAKTQNNEPLPSYSDRVNIGEFSVGNYKEFKLREELASLIEKYNKKFYVGALKPNIPKDEVINDKKQKYQQQSIINPIAVPDPSSAENNYSWMYLMTPYYNQLVNDFNQEKMENNVLKQHVEYYIEMQNEKNLLDQDFEQLKKSEKTLLNKITNINEENQMLESKTDALEKNAVQIQPQRTNEFNEKIDYLNNAVKSKDQTIDQLLNEIAVVKNEKDSIQKEVLTKKQRIDTLNIEFNTKEMEFQRLWEEEQELKAEIRGETTDCQQVRFENDNLQKDIVDIKNEISTYKSYYDQVQGKISDTKGTVQDYENRLRYANDVIGKIEVENQELEIEASEKRAIIEAQNKAYNELKQNLYMMSQNQEGKNFNGLSISTSSPILNIPKVTMPSTYKRSSNVNRPSINIMPSTSKALSQQVGPTDIKSYLSTVKKATIDLTSDIRTNRSANRKDTGPKVQFATMDSRQRFDSNTEREFDYEIEDFSMQKPKRQNQQQNQQQQRGGSINRNFVDSMAGVLGMSQDKQSILNMRSTSAIQKFPLNKPDNQDMSMNSPNPNNNSNYFKYSPDQETDISSNLQRRTLENSFNEDGRNTQFTLNSSRNNRLSRAGGPGKRNSQPQQLKQRQWPQSTRAIQNQPPQEEKYRQSTWNERMSQLPSNNAYKSTITFGEEGVTTKDQPKKKIQQIQFESPNPFPVARNYNIDIEITNEDDPKAKDQVLKFKTEKINELSDYRRYLQSKINHIPENVKSISQRQQRQETESEIQQVTKKLSTLKYDVKKLKGPQD